MGYLGVITVGLCLVMTQVIAQSRYQQRITLSDNQGSLVVYEPYVSQLGNLDYDGRARKACLTGMWLLYDLPFYNYANNRAVMQYHFGEDNYCVDLKELAGKVSSVRAVGNFLDYTADTLTLFEQKFLQGVDEFIYGDIRSVNLDKRASSLIITGSGSWTLHDGPNFRSSGNSVCLVPKNANGYPTIVTDTNSGNIRMPNQAIRSVRKGCSSNTRVVYV